MTATYWASVTRYDDELGGCEWTLDPSTHNTAEAAMRAVVARIPPGPERAQYSGTVTEMDASGARGVQFWPLDVIALSFGDPIPCFPEAVAE